MITIVCLSVNANILRKTILFLLLVQLSNAPIFTLYFQKAFVL